jgi:hypothetical protein
MRALVIAGLVALSPALALADVADGVYSLRTDGAQGTLRISGATARIDIIDPGRCSGSAEGVISSIGDRLTALRDARYGDVCTIEIELDANGVPVSTLDAGGCRAHHGASCGFTGDVVGREVASVPQSIDAAFDALARADRIAVQRALQDGGHYGGALDGVTGRGTRGGILAAARERLAAGSTVDLSTEAGAAAFLATLIGDTSGEDVPASVEAPAPAEITAPAARPEAASGAPRDAADFHGTWICDTEMFDAPAEFVFEDGSVTLKNLGATLGHDGPVRVGGRSSAVTIDLADGERLGLFEITAESMIVMSGGEIFDCRRAAE